jgi:hypothetical protein
MFNMVRVLMLAPYTLGDKEFLKDKIYHVDRRFAEQMVSKNVAKIISSFLNGLENKQIN